MRCNVVPAERDSLSYSHKKTRIDRETISPQRVVETSLIKVFSVREARLASIQFSDLRSCSIQSRGTLDFGIGRVSSDLVNLSIAETARVDLSGCVGMCSDTRASGCVLGRGSRHRFTRNDVGPHAGSARCGTSPALLTVPDCALQRMVNVSTVVAEKWNCSNADTAHKLNSRITENF